ncbi:MAG: hypothetical protein JRI61_08480 [Deltaproteobacteria bacterium]|nr:hypothetical protein [Deltaproteobacteria bacterium]
MVRAKLAVFALIVFLVGCKTIFEYQREDKFSETTSAYKYALTWSDYQAASAFLIPEQAQGIAFEKLKNIKVTGYEVKKVTVSDSRLNRTQIVEISYFKKNDMIIRTFNDEEVWEFDQTKDAWLLISGFPEFDLK